jgi:2-desacetyl-2-hydroxyethyl bacteriochlorophyllide A dehydrogenase
MKTIILNIPGQLELIQTSDPTQPKQDEALVKVHRIGICGTDYHAFQGNQPFFSYPRILGHELGVEVIDKGEAVSHLNIGDKCAIEPYFNAGTDQAVRMGKTNCGEKLSVFGVHEDGGMRESFCIPAKYLHPSASLSYEQLALIEPLSIGCHAVNRSRMTGTDKVLVIGAGPIGLATLQFAGLKTTQLAVMDVNEDRLRFCGSHLQLKGQINANGPDPIADIRSAFEGDLPTVILDATGNVHSMKKTLEYISHGGTIVFIGLFQGDFSFFDPLFHKKEITLMASRNSLGADFDEIIALMEADKINTDLWITHRIDFADLPESFPELLKPESGVIKAIVQL